MKRITTAVRRELMGVLRERYRDGTREQRREILEELVRLSGYHRKHAITVLNKQAMYVPGARQAPGAADRACTTKLCAKP